MKFTKEHYAVYDQMISTLPPKDDYTKALKKAVDCAKRGVDTATLAYLSLLKRYPVSIKEFIESPEYLNKRNVVWPKVVDELMELNNPDDDRLGGKYNESVWTGSIGAAKTTGALYTLAYQVYVLSCFHNPHAAFGLDPSSEILFVFQSLSSGAAKNVDYGRFRDMVKESPYFLQHFPYDKEVESELRFPNRVFVRPVAGDVGGTIGQNVMGGLIDEINFMDIIENSKKSNDKGTYDQASVLYDSIARRRKSRFMKQGKLPGMLCLVSSKNYPGQFTDRKMVEARTNKTIFVYDKRTWEVKPEGEFTGKTFKIFVGDESRQPRVLEDGEWEKMPIVENRTVLHCDLVDDKLCMDIPEEYRQEFEGDIMGSLRDIAGVSTLAKYPYIARASAVTECMSMRRSIFNSQETDFVDPPLKVFPELFTDPLEPRFCHIDLATGAVDCAGISFGYVKKFVAVRRGTDLEEFEMLPEIHIDGTLRLRPPRGGEIIFSKIRNIIYVLSKLGLNVQWVTLDSWQSTDTLQILRNQGYITGKRSLDTSMMPYDITKTAIYDGRVKMPFHEKLKHELVTLEIDRKKGKVDHPPQGCHCKDERIRLYNGGSISFGELLDTPDTYTCRSYNHATGEVEEKPITNPRITRYTTDMVQLELDTGVCILVTPDHPYLLVTGEYKSAKDLTPEDEIMS